MFLPRSCLALAALTCLTQVQSQEDKDEGPDSKPGEFPWVLQLRRKAVDEDKWISYCSATLIHPRLAITASYCVGKLANLNRTQDIIVRAGEWDTANDAEEMPHQDRRILYFVRHPGYNLAAKLKVHDIAIVLVDQPFEMTKNVAVIKMAKEKDTFTKTRCVVGGWGKDLRDTNPRTTMKKVFLPVLPNSECKKLDVFKKNGFSFPKGTLCVGGEENKDTCQGDGGAGLICPGLFGKTLAGIVSWGISCGVKNVPGVYTDLANYEKWIAESIEDIKSAYDV